MQERMMLNFAKARLAGRLALTAALGLAATGALAGEASDVLVSSAGSDTRMEEVRVADLNLTNADARSRLVTRIERAAERVCQFQAGSQIDKLPSAQACYQEARAGAFAQMDARGFAALDRTSASGGMR
jgi:UrcA family protein